jgi:hypothetical protein
MTNEDIRQNASQYVLNFEPTGVITEDRLRCYIAGAHSRDEEIKQIRNPWISVEERLPEVGDIVVINVHNTIDGGGEHHEEDQILVEKYDGRWICDRCEQHRMGKYLFDTISKTTHWMPIPPIEKCKTITLC